MEITILTLAPDFRMFQVCLYTYTCEVQERVSCIENMSLSSRSSNTSSAQCGRKEERERRPLKLNTHSNGGGCGGGSYGGGGGIG